MTQAFAIFLVVPPGLEALLEQEARENSFNVTDVEVGGVCITGDWSEVWRANLVLRGATKVLVRLASFRAMHLAQLDKRARKLAWADWFHPNTLIEVEASSRKSRIYHKRAAAERVQTAVSEAIGAGAQSDEAATTLLLKVRIEDDLVTISLDTSGESLHRRGHKPQVNKAPMRETLAALFLRACGFDGSQAVYDPMCGSGTFVIEAAERAAGLLPGRSRSFAFQDLASFDPAKFDRMRRILAPVPDLRFFGSDRDSGAIRMSTANAERAGVAAYTQFETKPISDAAPPCDTPGLVIVNPPYGGRIGNKKPLYGLYNAFGAVMKDRFKGWHVGLITSDPGLAKATGLRLTAMEQRIDHGGIRIQLYRCLL